MLHRFSAPHRVLTSIGLIGAFLISGILPAQAATSTSNSSLHPGNYVYSKVATTSSAKAEVNKELALVTGTPKVTGTPLLGNTYTATVGTWSPGTSLSYQWLRNGKAIAKATNKTYVQGANDVGKKLSVRVTGKKTGYKTVTKTSVERKATAAGTLKTTNPKVSGTPKLGTALTATVGKWTSGTNFSYQWLRNGKAIAKATKKTYKASANDVGKKLSVRVTGKKTGYKTVTKTSVERKATAAGTLKAPRPKISGTTRVGSTLKSSRGTWTAGTKFTYQWLRNGKAIKGATKTTYKTGKSDSGKKIAVRVTGKKAGYKTVSRTSAQVGPIKNATAKKSTSTVKTNPVGKSCPSSHPIKGNRPTDGTDWKYHVPGGQFYSRTTPEECFKTTSAASNAGYRASKR